MKRPVLLLISLFLVLLLGSCCTKNNCDPGGSYNTIELKDFSVNEIDTIYVKTYQRNSGFTVLTDSFLTSITRGTSGRMTLHLHKDIQPDKDYRLIMPALHVTFDIKEISIGKEVCSDCVLLWHSYYEELKSYEVNGTLQYSNYFYVKL